MIAPATPRTRHPLALRLQCRREWVEGQGTLSEIAGKHNVPPQTVVAWYRREDWTAARNRWIEKQWSDKAAPAKPPTYVPNTGDSTDDSRARKLQRLELQLEALDNFLDNAKTGDEWHKLSTAKHRLLENWYVLAGIPKPGSLKHKPAREPRRPSFYEWNPQPMGLAPIEPLPVPIAPAAPVPVEPPISAPTAIPTPRPAPSVGPVPIEVALRLRPAPLPTPAPPTTGKVVTTTTAATVPSAPAVSPNPKPRV